MLRGLVLVLTVVTGFSGLAYEVTWQKYLAILLGAHSEATASVLGLFLGGLSLGYWVFGAVTRRLVDRGRAAGRPAALLFVYGCIEAGIGFYCLLFPMIFPGALALSVWLPIGAGPLRFVADVALAALLIMPPAMLMGGTIPILTQALARSLEDATRFHAFVYAFNTAGAFLGALAAGFVLIPSLGLDGVLRAMGVVNLLVGTAFVLLGLRRRELAELESDESLGGVSATSFIYGGAALLVGFAMMAIQTILVRLGGLSFGSSEYTFSMVVAVFVLCIALGSLLVGALPKISRLALPVALWSLALLLAGLYFPLGVSPYWGHALRALFQSHDAAFGAFHVGAVLGFLVFVGPAIIVSGAILPLLFHAMRRELGNLGAQAGRLYSVNTIGSLLGALVGGYVLLSWLDLHQVYRVAICAVALAAALVTGRLVKRLGWLGSAALFAASVLVVMSFESWDPGQLMPGLIRKREPTITTYLGPSSGSRPEFVFYRDDPTSSVGVQDFRTQAKPRRSLIVNGKSDGNTSGDLGTMVLLGIVPALFAERTERAFVIGFGLGISAGELAELHDMREVRVAEISSGVIEAAPLFDFANHGAASHPKIQITRSDAYRTLLRSEGRYDVIVSEPSNPWVTGVEMLYSREFLEAARDRLTPGGVYAQWLHIYESDDEIIELVLRTYAEVFEHVAVWQNRVDVMLLGFGDAKRPRDLARLAARAERPDFRRALTRIGIDSMAALLVHEVLPLDVAPLAVRDGELQTLDRPLLSHQSARAFFRGEKASLPFSGAGTAARVGFQNSLLRHHLKRFNGDIPEAQWRSMMQEACTTRLSLCGVLAAAWAREEPESAVRLAMLKKLGSRPGEDWAPLVPLLGMFLGGAPPAARLTPVMANGASQRFDRYYAHAMPFDPNALLSLWERCGPPGETAPRCRDGLEHARQLVSGQSQTAPRHWGRAGANAGADPGEEAPDTEPRL